jgi:hypothetical protein
MQVELARLNVLKELCPGALQVEGSTESDSKTAQQVFSHAPNKDSDDQSREYIIELPAGAVCR